MQFNNSPTGAGREADNVIKPIMSETKTRIRYPGNGMRILEAHGFSKTFKTNEEFTRWCETEEGMNKWPSYYLKD